MPPPIHTATRTHPRAASLNKRQGPTDEALPYPPPQYTPSIALHASTLPFVDPSLPTPSSTSVPSKPTTTPVTASQTLHATHTGLLVAVALACAALLLLFAGIGWYMLRRKAGRLRAAHPRFSMFHPHSKTSALSQKVDGVWSNARPRSAANDGGQFVFISTSDEDVAAKDEKQSGEETPPLVVLGRIGSAFADDASSRRHSSPAMLEEFTRQWLSASASEPTRPLSLPPLGRDDHLYIQREKAKELAQKMRMRVVDSTRHSAPASRNSLLSELRRSMTHGLGIVHEGNEEADIGNTPVSALDEYSKAFSPAIPITELFDVDEEGKIVRLSVEDSPASPASDGMPPTPFAPPGIDNGSLHSDDSSGEDLESAVVICVARARSMDFKRPVLVSVRTSAVFVSPPASHSAPLLGFAPYPNGGAGAESDTHASNSASTISAFPSPPPMLGPILMSPTAFAEDVSQSVEERMFACKDSNPWSRAQYRMTIPGPVRS